MFLSSCLKKVIFIIAVFIISGCATYPRQITYYKKSPAYNIVEEAWDALARENFTLAHQYADKCINLYSFQAKEVNEKCADVEPAHYGECSILNDVAQCVYIKAQAYSKTKDYKSLRSACAQLEEFYVNAFVFSDSGWAWRPNKACQELMI